MSKEKGPTFDGGRVWWGAISVAPEAYYEARDRIRSATQTTRMNVDDASERVGTAATSAHASVVFAALAKSRGTRAPSPYAMSSASQLAESEFVSPEAVAETLGIKAAKVRSYCRNGQKVIAGERCEKPYIKALKIGSEWRISVVEFDRFLARCEGREVAER